MPLNLFDIPLIDRPDFEQLFDAGRFGCWALQARNLHDDGFCILDLEHPYIDDLTVDLIEVLYPIILPQIEAWQGCRQGVPRLQDGWQQYSQILAISQQALILDCLGSLYGRAPFAFQTLNFAVGSEQHFHSDAIHFHSYPHGFMCGVWIALEDVSIDSGPLVYYPRSHRLPYLNAASFDLSPELVAKEEHPQRFFEESWREAIKSHGFSPHRFLPKRGQVLIWHANLLHGGEQVVNREATRWSQVTHYFFADCLYTTPLMSFSYELGGPTLRNPFDIARDCRRYSDKVWDEIGLANRPMAKKSFRFTSK